ncbi:anthranilate phosphoribosyltransferase [Glomus cerebriforme]|uniref:Anthranilate phosphoribosyltransferase n=1 Tax=Glomus cerebriforme TaxID=658196 RepID=A0A397TMU8_9GLOM|nr:anthranilate phosphoribosyltransferase [Glomus cerebriforme]
MQEEGKVSSAQIAAFLVGLKLHKKDFEPEIVAACSKAMLNFSEKLDLSIYEGLQDSLIDIVGTGGDGMNTFNVSTAASIIVAGAGCKVAKYGNRSASSKSGSADILEKSGCMITNVTSTQAPYIINSTNFCFLFAQNFYPALKRLGPTRKEIGIPSILNLLGPLTNPAKPKRVVIGVHSENLGMLVAKTLKIKGVTEAMVVNGVIGLDEISPEGETTVWRVTQSQSDVIKSTISPADFGLPSHPISAVKSGSPEENAEILKKLLSNEYEGPILDFVLLNASAALVVSGKAKDFKDGVKLSRESITSGRAKKALESFKEATLIEISKQ